MTWNKTSTNTIAPLTDIRLHWLPRVARASQQPRNQWQVKHAEAKQAYQLRYHPAPPDSTAQGYFEVEVIAIERERQKFATFEQVMEFLLDELFEPGPGYEKISGLGK